MMTVIETKDGPKLRRVIEPIAAESKPLPEPPIPGARYDSVAGVWRKGAFIVPTRATVTSVPVRSGKAALSEQEQRIRAMSGHTDVKAVKAALRRQNPALQLDGAERLELALAMALLDAGVDPVTVQGATADKAWGATNV